MRFVRRGALVISLVLIVAVSVSALVRTRQLSTEHDLAMTAAGVVAAERLASIVTTISSVAAAGSDADPAVHAVAGLDGEITACAVVDRATTCAGHRPFPAESEVTDAIDRSAADAFGDVSVYDTTLTIVSEGPHLSMVVKAPTTVVMGSTPPELRVEVTTHIPNDDAVGGYVDDGARRQTAVPVSTPGDVFVTVTGAAAVTLPDGERTFYLLSVLLGLVLLVLAGVTVFVEHRNLQERASVDPLTKLPNRTEFERRAAHLLEVGRRDGEGLCLLLFDLNEFKAVNDTFGHAVGDDVLRIVGNRLRKALRGGDALARWGGDEFVALLTGIQSEDMAARRALEIADAVAGRTRIDRIGRSLRIKVSVGVAMWADDADLASVMTAADEAMYEAKRDGLTYRLARRPSGPTSATYRATPMPRAPVPPDPGVDPDDTYAAR